MEIEQYPPRKPNFLKVVLLACGAMLLIFVAAWVVIKLASPHIQILHHKENPNAQLALPADSGIKVG